MIADPIQPLGSVQAPTKSERPIIKYLAQQIFADTLTEVIHLSRDDSTGLLTLTPDPHMLMKKYPVETSNRLRGFTLFAMYREDSGLQWDKERVKDGLDRSKVVWDSS